tara:strand:+ start:911 stop:1585 length:675 start_codon:yes stop_codon:yes gene_type:complete
VKLLAKALIILLMGAGFFWIKTKHASVDVMYPEQCSFLIDEQLSSSFQSQLQEKITQQYQQSKNIQQIVYDISHQFQEVANIDAYICKSDKMCFSVDAIQPLYVVNDSIIVCSGAQLINKEHYRSHIVKKLRSITASCQDSVDTMTQFIRLVPQPIFDDFDIQWNGNTEVVLQEKLKQKNKLLFSLHTVPTVNDIIIFNEIKKNIKGKKERVFDFRFNNQVIVK